MSKITFILPKIGYPVLLNICLMKKVCILICQPPASKGWLPSDTERLAGWWFFLLNPFLKYGLLFMFILSKRTTERITGG